jgi:signal transduction histidine kinase/CheY-like chemotaxis protein
LLDPTGQLVGFRTVFADITLRKQAEAEREQALLSEQRLRRQIESLDGAVREIVATLATISTGSARSILQEITDQARLLAEAEYAACGIAGDVEAPFAPWVVSGMEPGRVAEMGRPPRAIGLLGLVVHEGRTVRVKDLRQHPAFRGFPADHPVMSSFLGVPIRYRGKSLGTLYLANKRGAAEFSEQDEQTIQELAERAAAAMEVARLSHGMQEAIASRENLLAVVSHDLRSPLSSLKYNIDLLILKSGSEDKWGIRQQLDLMIRSTAQMNRLICDLLNAAAVDSGTFTVDAQAEAVMPLVTGLVADIQSAVEDKGLQLTPTIARDLPAVWCDRLRIVQVLLNLVGNALKFTSRGGRISITVELLEKEVCFQVADTGSGIADEDKAHLFERYWKGKPSGTHGTGLGLYIAKGIVQAHGGRLWVESEVGVGTTFLFTLPLADERAAATLPGPAAVRLVPASAPPAAAGDPVPPRILLVDDDQNALSALTMLLAEEGFVVEAAASGLEALPKLYTLAPDVLVVDIEMPGLRGPELVAKARELHPDLPVIVLSGHRREHSTIVTLQKETRARYLSKPVDLDELIQAIRELGAKG